MNKEILNSENIRKSVVKPYAAMDVANYIVQYYAKKETPITNLLLMKILYYLQASFLVDGEKLFREKIEKWGYGPVVPEVYDYFKRNGSLSIKEPVSYMEIGGEEGLALVKYGDRELDKNDKVKIIEISQKIVSNYNKDPFSLVEFTHNEPMWKEDEQRIKSGELHIEYDENELKEYFSDSEKRWPWEI